MPGLEEGRRRGPAGTVNRWRQRPLRLSPDGDVPTPAPVQPPSIALRDRGEPVFQSVILDEDAARSLASDLLEWVNAGHVYPL